MEELEPKLSQIAGECVTICVDSRFHSSWFGVASRGGGRERGPMRPHVCSTSEHARTPEPVHPRRQSVEPPDWPESEPITNNPRLPFIRSPVPSVCEVVPAFDRWEHYAQDGALRRNSWEDYSRDPTPQRYSWEVSRDPTPQRFS